MWESRAVLRIALTAIALTAIALIATALIATPLTSLGLASATPSAGIEATELWRTSTDGTDYVYRQLTIAPGGSTGWHWHDGRLYGVIKQGTLTHNLADCSVDGVYSAGDGIFEPSGADHVHIGRNLGTTPVVMRVLYVLPAGSSLSGDAPDPGCGFS